MGTPLTNWAGTFEFSARRLHAPGTVDELRELIARTERIRAVGTAHSFSRIADSASDLVSVGGLPKTVKIDAERSTVTVAPGVRYGDVVIPLQEAGFALHNLASLPHISIVGACATGTHGSGVRNGNLSTAVSAMDLVTANGDLITVTRDTDDFHGMVIGLGSLGVVTSLTLDLVPAFDIRQYVYENMALRQVNEHVDEVLGSGYSVSLFTNWQNINQVWIKRADEDSTEPEPSWLGATLADSPLNPVPGMPVENATEQLGVPGPWHARLPHFRLEFTPSGGEELQSEYFVGREHAVEALEAVSSIGDRIAPVLQISEVRTIAADELWLSPAYRRDSVAIHFTWVKNAPAVAPVMAAVEEQLAPFAPRPHWAKLSTIPPETVRGRYERLADFQKLLRQYDPTGKFRNDWADSYFPRD